MSPKKSPLAGEHERLGARLVEFGGWEMPLSYPAGTIAEHLSCRRDAVVFDVSHLGTVRLEGRDSFDLLQENLSNDLARIGPGRAQYTHLLDEGGGVLDDIIVWWVSPERFDVMPNASNTGRVRERLGGEDVTATRAVLAVQGPHARERLAAAIPAAAEVPRFAIAPFEWEGEEGLAAGTGYTGEDGVELSFPAAAAPALFRAILGLGIPPAGLGARDTLRLEAGLPLHGHELAPDITPLEAGLSWVVGWNKVSFIGKDALMRVREAGGPARHLVGLLTGTRRPPREHERILALGEPVGVVTSGNYSPVLERGIALGFVPSKIGPGEDVVIEMRRGEERAAIVTPPFHRLATGSPS